MNEIELLVAFAILAVALSNISSSQQKTLYNVQVDEVVDGDTIEVSGEIDATVRLLCVDTPEVSSTNNPEEYGMQDTVQRRNCLSTYGDRATEYVAERINNTEVSLKVDPSAKGRGLRTSTGVRTDRKHKYKQDALRGRPGQTVPIRVLKT